MMERLTAAGVVMAALLCLGACDSPTPPRVQAPTSGCQERPYADASPWNTPINAAVGADPKSGAYEGRLATKGKGLTSDVDQYTIAVYCATASTPRSSVAFAGYYSDYLGQKRVGHGYAPVVADLPIPRDIVAPDGTDAQVVVWDQAAQVEYGFWQFAWKDGRATATNGYAIRTGAAADGRFPDGRAGRGAGLPYLGGLVRRSEVLSGRIDHALAFGYSSPSREHVFPASKSDGRGVDGVDLPEGTRLRLNPALTRDDLARYGVEGPGLVIARALQTYGMYVVDNSGSAKIYLEDRVTAGWDTTIHRRLLGDLPWTEFTVVSPPQDIGQP